MSSISATAPRKLVVLTLIVGLVAAALTVTIVLVASAGSGAGASPHPSLPAVTPQRQYIGGPGEGAPGMRGRPASTAPAAPAYDGTQSPGHRP
jgi:hypothetical protein